MGLYDRGYMQNQEPGGFSSPHQRRGPQSILMKLILINVVFWLLNAVLTNSTNDLTNGMAVDCDTLIKPWMWWKYLTYGFAHDPNGFSHIIFNMLALFMLGRDIERRYGSREFLRFYLVAVVLSGVVWNVFKVFMITQANMGDLGLSAAFMDATDKRPYLVGASGGVVAVVILYAMNFPNRTLLIYGIIPMPAWLLGLLIVGIDFYGAMKGGGNIAHSGHLTGAAFAFLYFKGGWNLSQMSGALRNPGRVLGNRQKRQGIRPHKPGRGEKSSQDQNGIDQAMTDLYSADSAGEPSKKDSRQAAEIDRILQKVNDKGMDRLTRKEKKKLEEDSRKRRKDD